MRLATLALLFAALQDGERVPGTIKIEGTPPPEAISDYDVEVAYPNLRFQRPLYLTHPRDGTDRLFVVEQRGAVQVFDNKPDATAAVALDISKKVRRQHEEEGLLGLAFHPDFAKNGAVFLHYSATPRRNVLSRFQMDKSKRVIVERTEKVLLEVDQPYGNHNGGMIEFGPDGRLYITLGDGGDANDPRGHGQNLGTLLGAILRIDVDRGNPYAIPKDNPFVDRKGARPEIWAYGLRNVWRFSFDRATGDLWAGDVGQDRWEEIDIIRRGGNYGWNKREGLHEFGRGGAGEFVDPVHEYGRREGVSVTGGYVYRGRRLPGLFGAYLYADYQSGNIWALRHDGAKVTENKLIARGPQISSFGEDRDGEVYFTSFDGRIYRFKPRGKEDDRFPLRLSQTGLFGEKGKPHASLAPYDVRVPVWADGATAERHMMLPGLEKIGASFPQGSIFVQTFSRGGKKIETRLLVHRDAWEGFSYAWNDEQTDAYLVSGHREGDRWSFPGRVECMVCHNAAAGPVLGFRPEQIDAKKLAAYFETVPAAEPYAERDARAYLAVNCATCHQPNGAGNSEIDLRFDTPPEKMRVIDADPTQGNMDVPGSKIVMPGRTETSVLYLRMADTGPLRMPRLSHTQPDEAGLKLIAEWIRGLRR